jgi:hypothetical protein
MHTRRTLIIRKPDLNSFERYKIDDKSVIQNFTDTPAFHQFMAHNPLPYYIGNPEIQGGSWLGDFARGFDQGFSKTLEIGSKILPFIGLGEKKKNKKKKVQKMIESEEEEIKHEVAENKKLNKIEKLAKDMKKENKKMLRGELVRKLMKEKGMTLGQASRHIKENNLL